MLRTHILSELGAQKSSRSRTRSPKPSPEDSSCRSHCCAKSRNVQPATRHIGAYELYLKGRGLLYQRGLTIPKAVDCFRQAVSLDPECAHAWAGLAGRILNLRVLGIQDGGRSDTQALERRDVRSTIGPSLAEAKRSSFQTAARGVVPIGGRHSFNGVRSSSKTPRVGTRRLLDKDRVFQRIVLAPNAVAQK